MNLSSRFFRAPFRSHGGCRIQQHLLEHREVLNVALAPQSGNAAKRLRAVILDALRDCDQPCVFEYLQMPVEIAVGQRTQLFQVAEQQSSRMSDQRREHAQAGAFVNDAVQPVVGESGNGALLASALIQEVPHTGTEVRLRPEAGRRRTEYPSSRAKAPGWRSRQPGKRVPPPDTTRQRQTFAAEEIGTRRT